MLEFILQYWLEILFGLIIAGLGWFLRKFFKMVKKEYGEKQEKILNELHEEIQTKHDFQEEEIKALKKGILSLQRPLFLSKCQKLLEPEHIITLEEYTDIDSDHEAYNALGGNHQGDQMFKLVHKKYSNQITQN